MAGRIGIALLVALVIGGHIAMWTSDMPRDLALRLTLMNAAGWALVLVPILFVGRWLKAVERRNAQADHDEA